MDEQPITPRAGPFLDEQGHLTYIGEDGHHYVVDLPADIDEASVERVMVVLRSGYGVFQEMERLAHRWIAQVSGPDLDPRAALVLLLTTLETALEEAYPEPDDS